MYHMNRNAIYQLITMNAYVSTKSCTILTAHSQDQTQTAFGNDLCYILSTELIQNKVTKQCHHKHQTSFLLSPTNQPRLLTYLICHVINNYDAVGSTVVAGSDGPKPFLTCSVPLRCRRRLKKKKNSKG